MATEDDQRERDEHTLVVRNEIMHKIQRGEVFSTIEEATADELGIRVPAFLRPGGGNDPDLDDLDAGERLDDEIERQTGLHPAEPGPLLDAEFSDHAPPELEPIVLADLSGQEWLEVFYNALAELWANAGWLPFAMGQLGAAVQAGTDAELVDRMFAQASDDILGLAEATKRVLEVAQQGLKNLQARRTP